MPSKNQVYEQIDKTVETKDVDLESRIQFAFADEVQVSPMENTKIVNSQSPETESVCVYPGAAITFIEAVEEGRAKEQRWGVSDICITVAAWLPMIVIFTIILLTTSRGAISLILSLYLIFTSLPLGGWPMIAATWKGNGPKIDFGLTLRLRDIGWGEGHCSGRGATLVQSRTPPH